MKTWSKIDWNATTGYIQKQQDLIQEAFKAGDIEQVKLLQQQLFCSIEACLSAVHYVTSMNFFGTQAGIDGVLWLSNKDKRKASQHLFDHNYNKQFQQRQPSPLLEVPYLDPKMGIAYVPTIEDRAYEYLFKLVLDPIVCLKIDPNAFGYKPTSTMHDALDQLTVWLTDAPTNQLVQQIDSYQIEQHKVLKSYLLNSMPIFNNHYLHQWLSQEHNILQDDLLLNSKDLKVSPSPLTRLYTEVVFQHFESTLQEMLSTQLPVLRNADTVDHFLKVVRYRSSLILIGTPEAIGLNKDWVNTFLKQRGYSLNWKQTEPRKYLVNGFVFLDILFKSKATTRYTMHKPVTGKLQRTPLYLVKQQVEIQTKKKNSPKE